MISKLKIVYNADNNKFMIECPYHMNNIVRAFPNRRFIKRHSKWQVPVLSRNIDYLKNLINQNLVDCDNEVLAAINNCDNQISISNRVPFPEQYKFKMMPFDHQRQALDYSFGIDQVALFMEMGTGKSKIIIDLACCYWQVGDINALLIICPVSIRTNWINEIQKHAPIECKAIVCDPSTKSKERDIEKFITTPDSALKILIVGTESISQRDNKTNKPIGKAFNLADKFLICHTAMMAIDEAHLIKNHDANRSRNAKTLGLLAKKKLIATGTPISQGIMDLYMQFEFLNPNIIGIGDYYSFRNRYAIMGGFENKQIVGYDNTDELMALIKPWVFQCTKKQVLPDLPDKLYSRRYVKLSKKQREIYNQMKRDRIVQLPELRSDGSNIELVSENILTTNTALQQIVSGYISYNDDESKSRKKSEIVNWKYNPKIIELINILDEHREKKVIIWAKYRKEISDVVIALRSKYGEEHTVEYHGGIPKDQRDENERLFKEDPNVLFFVANQATGGVGLTLNEANLSIYLSNSFKYVDRIQSEDRNHRIGQKDKVFYIDIIAEDTVDEIVAQSIENKQDLANFVRESLKNTSHSISDVVK